MKFISSWLWFLANKNLCNSLQNDRRSDASISFVDLVWRTNKFRIWASQFEWAAQCWTSIMRSVLVDHQSMDNWIIGLGLVEEFHEAQVWRRPGSFMNDEYWHVTISIKYGRTNKVNNLIPTLLALVLCLHLHPIRACSIEKRRHSRCLRFPGTWRENYGHSTASGFWHGKCQRDWVEVYL